MTTRITGTNSGLDTDTLVKAALATHQTKIDKEYQNQKVMEYQQTQYKEIMTSATDFFDKYLDVSKSDSLLRDSSYSIVEFKSGDETKVTAKGFAGADLSDYSVNISQLAEKASTTFSKSTFDSLNNKTGVLSVKVGDTSVYVDIVKNSENETDFAKTVRNLNEALNKKGLDVSAKYSEFSKGLILQSGKLGENVSFKAAIQSDITEEEIADKTKTFDDSKYVEYKGKNAKGVITKGSETYEFNDLTVNTLTIDNVQFDLKGPTIKTTTDNSSPLVKLTHLDVTDVGTNVGVAAEIKKTVNGKEMTTTISSDGKTIRTTDGSTTTETVTDAGGNVTITTKNADGSKQTVTKKDSGGIITETKTTEILKKEITDDAGNKIATTTTNTTTIDVVGKITNEQVVATKKTAPDGTETNLPDVTKTTTDETDGTGKRTIITTDGTTTSTTIVNSDGSIERTGDYLAPLAKLNKISDLQNLDKSDGSAERKITAIDGKETTIYATGKITTTDGSKTTSTETINGNEITTTTEGSKTTATTKDSGGNETTATTISEITPVTLDASINVTDAKDKIVKFIDDYNKIIESINTKLWETRDKDYLPLTDEQKKDMSDTQIEAWEKKAKTGLLRKDSDLERIVEEMKSAMSTVMSGTGLRLESIGISPVRNYTTRNGLLTVDGDKLAQALKDNGANVKDLFSRLASKDTTEKGGVLTRLASVLKTEMKSSDSALSKKVGIVGTSTETSNTLSKGIADKKKYIKQLQSQYTTKETALYNKYAQLEKTLESLTSQQNSLAQLLGQ